MSSDYLDLEELLFRDENFRENLILVNFIQEDRIFSFLGKKSMNKFLTYVLNYEEKAIIVRKEEIHNEEITLEIGIYKRWDGSWIIGHFISVQEEVEIYMDNVNIRRKALLNLLLPISIEINYGENIRDITDKFILMIGMYPRLRILEFYEREPDPDLFQEENSYVSEKHKNLLEKRKIKPDFLVYPELLRFYRDFESIDSLSFLNYKI